MKRRYRIHVEADNGVCTVRLVRWRWAITSYATVATINLAADDAEERLAEARYRASNLAQAVNALEKERFA